MIGIDVSSYQNEIDWAAVAASGKVTFAYAKATEGAGFVDDQYKRNQQIARERKILFGAYHFFRPGIDAIAQAAHFIATADFNNCDLMPMVDVEVSDGLSASQIIPHLATFNAHVEAALGGRHVIIYSSLGFWNGDMNGTDAFNGHPFWIAQYNSDDAPTLPAGFDHWEVWQYADDGICPGIAGHVDMDRTGAHGLYPLLKGVARTKPQPA